MDKNKSFISLYIILAITALLLILTGLLLEEIIEYFGVKASKLYLHITQAAFILSGIGDIALIFYAKKKLS